MQATKLISSSPLVTNYAYSCNFFNLNSIYAQSLRWKRKPMWLPTAKTKVFRVSQRPVIPKDEHIEIQRLYNNYRTYYRSIRRYMLEVTQAKEIQMDQSLLDRIEEEDYNQCMKLNDEWNKKIAAERAVRLQKEKEIKVAEAMEILENQQQKIKQNREKLTVKIKEAKLLAPTFITRKNIDKAIEEALANVVDHNRALNIDGSWYTETPEITTVKTEGTELKQ